jgi:hypothetical protein
VASFLGAGRCRGSSSATANLTITTAQESAFPSRDSKRESRYQPKFQSKRPRSRGAAEEHDADAVSRLDLHRSKQAAIALSRCS